MLKTILAAGAAAVVLAAAGAPALAAEIGDPRLDGDWFIDEAFRRNMQRTNPRAELTPAGAEIAERNRNNAQQRLARGEFVNLQAATCGINGLPFMLDSTSEPWHLRLSKNLILQAGERYLLTPRYFYTDGRKLPDVSKMPRSSNGYSVAHWEGKTLVIETRGLPRGGTAAGGLKGPNTKLTERASVDETGDRLTWTFTFEDPELLVRPHTYSETYIRAPKGTYALYEQCDPNSNPSLLATSPTQEGAEP
jgi:hypothetical protein